MLWLELHIYIYNEILWQPFTTFAARSTAMKESKRS
jgi:hypothetical protein